MPRKTITVKLSELDTKIVLEALGDKVSRMNGLHGFGQRNTATQRVIDKVYRAMGVRLDQ